MPDLLDGDQRGGITAQDSLTPPVQAAAYATGDLIGGKMEFTTAARRPGLSGIIHSIVLASDNAFTSDVDIVFFDTDPTNTTFSENNAIAVDIADVTTVIGVVNLVAADVGTDLGTPDVLFKSNLGLAFNIPDANDTRSIFAAAIMRGAHTPGSTAALTWRLGILQD